MAEVTIPWIGYVQFWVRGREGDGGRLKHEGKKGNSNDHQKNWIRIYDFKYGSSVVDKKYDSPATGRLQQTEMAIWKKAHGNSSPRIIEYLKKQNQICAAVHIVTQSDQENAVEKTRFAFEMYDGMFKNFNTESRPVQGRPGTYDHLELVTFSCSQVRLVQLKSKDYEPERVITTFSFTGNNNVLTLGDLENKIETVK